MTLPLPTERKTGNVFKDLLKKNSILQKEVGGPKYEDSENSARGGVSTWSVIF